MATVMLRRNNISLKVLGNTALSSLCSFALISGMDCDHRYDKKFYGNGILGRLRC